MVPWVGLQCVIVVFPDHTHFFVGDNEALFYSQCILKGFTHNVYQNVDLQL